MPDLTLEKLHVKKFLSLLLNKEIEPTVQKPGEPDFFIINEGRLIGIEHSRLIRLPDSKGINIMGHTKIADKIMSKSETLFKAISSICLMVHVSFKCDYGLSSMNPIQLHNNDIKPLSEFISRFVFKKLPIIYNSNHGHSFYYENFDRQIGLHVLPQKIESITITNTKKYSTPCWAADQGGTIPSINSVELKKRLLEKSKKPKNYEVKYDEIWLLVVEDGLDFTSSFDLKDQTIEKIQTPFNRVFILQNVHDSFVELTVTE